MLNYSDCKAVKKFCADLFSTPNWREVVDKIESCEDDFEVDNVRFINSNAIDQTQEDELGNDDYALGCFNASFLSSILEIDQDVIEAMQKAEAYEAIGKLIKSLGKLGEVQQEYARYDGYGHHFNSYDFGMEEIKVDGQLFYVFDNH